jgi:hypothetical protein
MDMANRNAGATPLRTVVIALAVIEAAAILTFAAVMHGSTDPLGDAIASGMKRLALIPLLAFVLPGLVLGLANRHLSWALALLVLALPVGAFIWAKA